MRRVRPEGGAGGERKAPCIASIEDNFAVSKSPWWGLTRRLRRGLGLAVPRGAHTFLSVAKEKCAKESQRHGDSGKKASIAHFDGGARYVARSMVKLTTFTFVRARAHSFPLSKRARLFPSAAYRRSAPPQSAWGKLTPCGVGYFGVAGRFCGVDKQAGSLFPRLAAGRLAHCWVGCFGAAGRFCGVDEQAGFLFCGWRRGRLTHCGVGCFGVAGRFCGVDEQANFLFSRLAAGRRIPCGL